MPSVPDDGNLNRRAGLLSARSASCARDRERKGDEKARSCCLTGQLEAVPVSAVPLEGSAACEHVEIERQRALKLARRCDTAHAGPRRSWADANGTQWDYVVLALGDGGRAIRIVSCAPAVEDLHVPCAVEGVAVRALGVDALAELEGVSCLRLPRTVVSIGACAFRNACFLEEVVLSADAPCFDAGWFRGCAGVARIVLPGLVESIDASLFDIPALTSCCLGRGTRTVAPGTFVRSSLARMEVATDNPWLASDGSALYANAGAKLLVLTTPMRAYAVHDGCRFIAEKAFSHFSCLESVSLPASVEAIGAFAFSRTGIAFFEAPESLARIERRAFFDCAALARVELNEGLRFVGSNAFTATALARLRLPASIEAIECPIAAHTSLTYTGDTATFSIAPRSRHLFIDSAGGLYRAGRQGRALVALMDPDARSYAVAPGTVAIDEGACANHECIASVDLPAGLLSIGRAAFRGCHELVHVALPDSVRRICDEAFLDTNLERFRIPAALQELGANALVTQGAHSGIRAPALHDVIVAPGNDRFRMASGCLLERKTARAYRLVVCTGAERVVRVPADVTEICAYAFNNVQNVRELHLHDRIIDIGMRGLAVADSLDAIRIDVSVPVDGRSTLELRFPKTDRGFQQMMLALSGAVAVDAATFYHHYDNSIINASSFDAAACAGLGVYEQAARIVERLRDPIFLTRGRRQMLESILRRNVCEVCAEVAKHADRAAMEGLIDLGFVNEDNIDAVVGRVVRLRDAAATDYLLEAKRERFGRSALDFDL